MLLDVVVIKFIGWSETFSFSFIVGTLLNGMKSLSSVAVYSMSVNSFIKWSAAQLLTICWQNEPPSVPYWCIFMSLILIFLVCLILSHFF